MTQYLLANPATAAALLSAIAALASVLATWLGPRSAAKLAERLREKVERENEGRRMKLQVFSVLMQERATIAAVDSVRMLNSIDLVFSDAASVREAWASLFTILSTSSNPHIQLREEKLRQLLSAMAGDLGLAMTIKVDDIGRIYYPNALAQQEELEMLQRERALRSIRSQGEAQQQILPATASILPSKFPPKPGT